MSPTLDNAVVFTTSSLAVLAALLLIGYGCLRTFRERPSASTLLLAAPAGLVVTVAFSGAYGLASGRPIRTVVVVALSTLVALGALRLANDLRVSRVRAVLDTGKVDLLLALAVVLFIQGYWLYSFRALWGQGRLSTVSENNDVLAFAYKSKHLAELGTSHPGWIANRDIGFDIIHDVPGTFALLVSAGALLKDELHATMPTLAALVCGAAVAGFVFLRFVCRLPPVPAALAAVIFPVTFAFSYNSYQFFLSERIAICVVLFSIAWLPLVRKTWTRIVSQAVIAFTLLISYEHALVFELPLAAALVTIPYLVRRRLSIRRDFRPLLHVLVGTGIGLVAIGPYIAVRLVRLRLLATAPAGWPMADTDLAQTLGLTGIDIAVIDASQNIALLAGIQAMLLAAVIIGVGILGPLGLEDRALAALVLFIPYCGFLYFVMKEPGSYRQWKAMAFATPFVVLAAAIAIYIIAIAVQRWTWVSPRRAIAGMTIVLVLWLGITFHGTYQPSPGIQACVWDFCPINDQVRANFAVVDAELGPELTGVNLGTAWPSMTAAYLLWGRPLALRSQTYYGVSGVPTSQSVDYGPPGVVVTRGAGQ